MATEAEAAREARAKVIAAEGEQRAAKGNSSFVLSVFFLMRSILSRFKKLKINHLIIF
jgi:hypothetical protein